MMNTRTSSSRSNSSKSQPTKRSLSLLILLFVAIAFVSISQLTLLHVSSSSSSSLLQIQQENKNRVQPSSLSLSSSSLESYDPNRYPVLAQSLIEETLRTKKRIKVGIVTIDPLVGTAKHLLYDGIKRSNYIELIGIVSLYSGPNNTHPTILHNPNDAQVWLIDGEKTAKLKRNFTSSLLSSSSQQAQPPPPPYVVFVDYVDRFEFQVRHYNQHNIWDKSHVRLAVRSIIQGRNFFYRQNNNNINNNLPTTTSNSNYEKEEDEESVGWNMGTIAYNQHTAGGPMIHCPYSVRSDIVETLMGLLLPHQSQIQKNSILDSTTMELLESAIFVEEEDEDLRRRPMMDVLHMWKITSKEGTSKLRNAVSKLVRRINGTEIDIDDNDKHHNRHHHEEGHFNNNNTIIVQTSIEEQGERYKVGRNTVDPSYVQAMLNSKIVVVTQRDKWEDHYRLFEALVCGAMIMSDRMIAPPKGYVHKQNIVFFDNITNLESNIKYYLRHPKERKQIAKNGWELAMTKHRSWHRIEEILFGQILTQ